MKKEDFAQRVEMCFRVNDIRGIYDEEFDEEMAYKVGRAILLFSKSKTIIVGNDMRYSSPLLKKALIDGITNQGGDVIDIGMIDTPGLYFSSTFLKLPAVCVTASHNPIKDNGIKFVHAGAVPIRMGSGLEKIKELVLKKKFNETKKRGKVFEKNIFPDYKKHVLSFIKLDNLEKLKIVFDAGNGVAGKIIPLIYDGLGFDIIKMYFEITGYFDHHEANPLKEENTKDLRVCVMKEKADVGITFDGDMDRVFFIDERGNQIEASAIAVLFIKHFSKELKRRGFVYSATMSKYLAELAHKLKIPAHQEKVGHSLIKERMRKEMAFFGCEDSGHFYYKKNYYADSGIITSLVILEIFSIMRKKDKTVTFSSLFEHNPYVKIKEKSFHIKDSVHAYEKIQKHFEKMMPRKVEKLDGLTFIFDDYWYNIRFSRTESALRLNLEADTDKIMKEKSEEIGKFLEGL